MPRFLLTRCCEERGEAANGALSRRSAGPPCSDFSQTERWLTGEFVLTLKNICRNLNGRQILYQRKCSSLAVEYEEC